jgi:hypothetical protein
LQENYAPTDAAMGFVYSEASDVDVSDDGNRIFSPAKQIY